MAGGIDFDSHLHHQYHKAYFGGRRFVDFIGKFEEISDDWAYIAGVIGCGTKLPHENRSVHGHYRDYYDAESKKIVAEIYRRDINIFGYEF
jgi:hypothetical protein